MKLPPDIESKIRVALDAEALADIDLENYPDSFSFKKGAHFGIELGYQLACKRLRSEEAMKYPAKGGWGYKQTCFVWSDWLEEQAKE